ncbi:MAG: hypothetical protein JZU52_09565 [Lamprocystis purpurea]|jgi:hypothetical protein|uniref:hypothetical protein n=1 Tax=Lamprocystis purpurea TaxID=61598 RepID=UPI00058CA99A|nr:hypothetical protein [Lamprocystis purpurea]MBV5273872.1 hypothetical protein [Lamprocystis purpurea]
MVATSTRSAVKVIGAKGQILLGKKYAGRQVLVEEQEPGVWLVRTVTVLPDNERWLHESKAAADLERALAWATANPPDDANTEQLLEKLADGQG